MKRIIFIVLICLLTIETQAQKAENWSNATAASVKARIGATSQSENDLRYPKISDGFLLTDTFPRRTEVDASLLLKANSTTVTANNLRNKLQFIVAATGIPPINGDSILTHSYLKNKQVEVIVNGLRLYENYTATNVKHGYRFNNTTGVIVFNPVLATGNIVQVNIIPNTITAVGLEQNMFKYSEQLNNAVWNSNGTFLANQKADLSGNMTLEKLTLTAGNVFRYYNGGATAFPVTTNTSYTLSLDFDPGTLTTATCRILDSDGDPFYVNNTSLLLQATSGTVSRVTFTFTTDASTTNINIYILQNVSDGYCFIGRMQLAKSVAASYVTTTTAAIP